MTTSASEITRQSPTCLTSTSRLFAFIAKPYADCPPTRGGRGTASSDHGARTTSAPRSARMRPQNAPAVWVKSKTRTPSSIRLRLAAGAREDLRPRRGLHRRLALLDLVGIEPSRRVDAVDRVDGAHEVVLESVRHRGVDRHPPLEPCVHRGPLRAAGGEPLGRDEGLPGATWHGTPDIVARVHPCGER